MRKDEFPIVDKLVDDSINAVLDKIRAEIDGAEMPKNRMSFFRDGIDCALNIIDKYRKEHPDETPD